MRYHVLDLREKPSLLMACLSGEALGLASKAVPNPADLGNPASFRTFLTALEASYGLRRGIRRFRAFRKIVEYRNTSKNLDSYMRQRQLLLAASHCEGLRWEDTEAFLLLINADLDQLQMEHVMAQLKTEYRAAEITAAAYCLSPPDNTITVAQVDFQLRTLAQARQMRSLGSRIRY